MSQQLDKLAQLILEKIDLGAIETIWEIGSRDGHDAMQLAHKFPNAQIHSFEPNPETFDLVKRVSQNSRNRIFAYNFALADQDKTALFYKIDTKKTVTSWLDGNPGASSFFLADPSYEIEKYVQIPIHVECKRADTQIKDSGASVPQILWVDVQGSEKMVFVGFGSFLKDVKFIYVELSLVGIYDKAPLADEVIKFLKKDFYWTNNITKSNTQIDSLFVSKSVGGLKGFLVDKFLRVSLKTGYKYKISHDRSPLRIVSDISMRFVNSVLKFILSKNDSISISRLMFRQVLRYRRNRGSLPMAYRYRQLLNVVPPYNPLKRGRQIIPEIEVMIPVTHKDADVLELSIAGAVSHVENQIAKITLVCPNSYVDFLQQRFTYCNVVGENAIVNAELQDSIGEYFDSSRQGWIKQQFLKNLFVLRSLNPVLVLDADTIMLKPKLWINGGGEQVLSISDEYHNPYADHFSKFSGLPVPPWSFVTHHQLMQPWIVREYLNENDETINRFINSATRSELSSISEYHSYGSWMFSNHPDLITYAKWMNRPVSKKVGVNLNLSEIKERYPRACSVSLHDYLG